MNCAVCGKDNQAGTRSCVHCGAALAAPRPVAASTAATSTGTTTIVRPAPTPGPDTVTRAAAALATDAAGASARPAYDTASPGSGGKVLFAIGVAALVIAAGFVGYKIFGGSAEVKDSFAKFEAPAAPREAAPPPGARPAEPPPAPPEPAKVEDKAAVLPVDAMKSEAPKPTRRRRRQRRIKRKALPPGSTPSPKPRPMPRRPSRRRAGRRPRCRAQRQHRPLQRLQRARSRRHRCRSRLHRQRRFRITGPRWPPHSVSARRRTCSRA